MKNLALVLTGIFFLAACQVTPPRYTLADKDPCEKRKASEMAGNNFVTINARSAKPKAIPKNRCAKPGETFEFRIRPTTQPINTVLIVSKGNLDDGGPTNWLTKSNDTAGNTITVQIPDANDLTYLCDLEEDADYDEKCAFEYAIFIKGKQPVDPRITVHE